MGRTMVRRYLRRQNYLASFYTPEEQLVPTPAEAERQRAEAAEAKLARLQAQLVEGGIELDPGA